MCVCVCVCKCVRVCVCVCVCVQVKQQMVCVFHLELVFEAASARHSLSGSVYPGHSANPHTPSQSVGLPCGSVYPGVRVSLAECSESVCRPVVLEMPYWSV